MKSGKHVYPSQEIEIPMSSYSIHISSRSLRIQNLLKYRRKEERALQYFISTKLTFSLCFLQAKYFVLLCVLCTLHSYAIQPHFYILILYTHTQTYHIYGKHTHSFYMYSQYASFNLVLLPSSQPFRPSFVVCPH